MPAISEFKRPREEDVELEINPSYIIRTHPQHHIAFLKFALKVTRRLGPG